MKIYKIYANVPCPVIAEFEVSEKAKTYQVKKAGVVRFGNPSRWNDEPKTISKDDPAVYTNLKTAAESLVAVMRPLVREYRDKSATLNVELGKLIEFWRA